ncbi:MAG: NAD(P)/FAD-dependent oxidoreductase, partial [Bacteroidota bacterium]
HKLQGHGLQIALLEARPRLGGRIRTQYDETEAPLEMGATWLGKKHQHLVRLLEELELPIFPQRLGDHAVYEPISTSPPQLVVLPPNDEPSFRIAGGNSALIQALADRLGGIDVKLNYPVQALEASETGVKVVSDAGILHAQKVVSTLPPRLFVEQIQTGPDLPQVVKALAQHTHTWMGESIKIALTFAEPFWREEGMSGTVFSSVGPVTELYDHSDVTDVRYALKGFLNGAYFSLDKAGRQELILNQLRRYFGARVDSFLSYAEAVWRHEPYTFADYEGHILPHQHNGHPMFRQPFMDGRLFLAGSETAPQFPGYMDGAVQSAEWVVEQLKLK